MILARLTDADKYAEIQPQLAAGFHFLRRTDLADLADGKYSIDGEQVFAIVARSTGRGQAESPLEFHRRYIDIQYVVSGVDVIGWLPTADCRQLRDEYSPETDLGFYRDRPSTWLHIPPTNFAIFFPEDAHAPLTGAGTVHKVVIKVAVT